MKTKEKSNPTATVHSPARKINQQYIVLCSVAYPDPFKYNTVRLQKRQKTFNILGHEVTQIFKGKAANICTFYNNYELTCM